MRKVKIESIILGLGIVGRSLDCIVICKGQLLSGTIVTYPYKGQIGEESHKTDQRVKTNQKDLQKDI